MPTPSPSNGRPKLVVENYFPELSVGEGDFSMLFKLYSYLFILKIFLTAVHFLSGSFWIKLYN